MPVFAVLALSISAFALAAAPPAANPLQSLRALAPSSPGIILTQATASSSRLVLVRWDGREQVLTQEFSSAADPEISFDGKRLLFAGRKLASDHWQVYEMNVDGTDLRQITKGAQDCRQPVYQSRFFTLDAPEPWHQVAFVSGGSLYTVKLDGSELQRVTYTQSEDADPVILPDGRMVYASKSASTDAKPQLFGVNLDGTDYALFTMVANGARMACSTDRRLVVFVETDGRLGSVSVDRPLRSYKRLTQAAEGVFQSPSPLPGGEILVSRRTGQGKFGIWQLDPATGVRKLINSTPNFDSLQAKLAAPRPEPDGRGSAVDTTEPTGKLYCLNVNITDQPKLLPRGAARRVRILAGPVETPRALGEADIEDDGSFHLQLPANQPVKMELLGANGSVLRSSAWVWVRNKENRGCIGCHEDGELTPENREAKAIVKKAVRLGLGGQQ